MFHCFYSRKVRDNVRLPIPLNNKSVDSKIKYNTQSKNPMIDPNTVLCPTTRPKISLLEKTIPPSNF